MNSLSWLIYFAGVNEAILNGVIPMAVLIIFACATGVFLLWINECYVITKRTIRNFIIAGGIVAVIATVVPDRQTLMLIASSEIGEKVINSDKITALGSTVDPSITLLKTWIENQTEVLKQQKKK
jgi:hypothetical protein